MRSKTDFYRLFFEQLARRGFDVKRSQSSDYIADIYFKNQLVAYFSKADTVIQNPFVTVKDKLIRLINDTAQDTANKAGICRDCPYARYFTSWEQITPVSFPNPMQNRIIENYCSGVYLSPDQVIQLLKDMEQDPKVLDDLEGLWSNGQIAVLKKALSAAAKSGVGLLEATEVVEPNPISPNESTSYSNLYHCDRDGVYLYIDAVSGQLADAIGKNEG